MVSVFTSGYVNMETILHFFIKNCSEAIKNRNHQKTLIAIDVFGKNELLFLRFTNLHEASLIRHKKKNHSYDYLKLVSLFSFCLKLRH